MIQISEDVVRLEDPIEALEFMLERRGVVEYTGGSPSWRAKLDKTYPVTVPEAIWTAGTDQTLEFLEKELSGARTILGIIV